MQMDLTNLGASELLRYDFGHCTIDKVVLLPSDYSQTYLSTVWIAEILQKAIMKDNTPFILPENKQSISNW